MTDRLRKKADKRKRAALHAILDLVLDINGLQASDRGFTGSHPTAFFNFSGHVGNISADIHTRGWSRGSEADKRYYASICHEPYSSHQQALTEVIRELAAIKKNPRRMEPSGIQQLKNNLHPHYTWGNGGLQDDRTIKNALSGHSG